MSPGGYRVEMAGSFAQDVRVLSFRAVRKGLTSELERALIEVRRRLAVDPTVWGDPVKNYLSLGIVVYRRLEGPIIVEYGVDEPRRYVYLRSVTPYPGRGLESVP